MHNFVVAALVAISPVAAPAAALAQQAPTAAAAVHYTTADTDLGTLLDDPASKAVLNKYIAQMIGNDQISAARSLTLKALQQYAGDTLTDETLAKIDADLAKLPSKKPA